MVASGVDSWAPAWPQERRAGSVFDGKSPVSVPCHDLVVLCRILRLEVLDIYGSPSHGLVVDCRILRLEGGLPGSRTS